MTTLPYYRAGGTCQAKRVMAGGNTAPCLGDVNGDGVCRHAADHTDEQTAVTFADGQTVEVPSNVKDDVRGLDADGDLVVVLHEGSPESFVPLTPCCKASGKGWLDDDGTAGVVCRSCFEWVDDKYGTCTEITIPRLPAGEAVMREKLTPANSYLLITRVRGKSASRRQHLIPHTAEALERAVERARERGATNFWTFGPAPDGEHRPLIRQWRETSPEDEASG